MKMNGDIKNNPILGQLYNDEGQSIIQMETTSGVQKVNDIIDGYKNRYKKTSFLNLMAFGNEAYLEMQKLQKHLNDKYGFYSTLFFLKFSGEQIVKQKPFGTFNSKIIEYGQKEKLNLFHEFLVKQESEIILEIAKCPQDKREHFKELILELLKDKHEEQNRFEQLFTPFLKPIETKVAEENKEEELSREDSDQKFIVTDSPSESDTASSNDRGISTPSDDSLLRSENMNDDDSASVSSVDNNTETHIAPEKTPVLEAHESEEKAKESVIISNLYYFLTPAIYVMDSCVDGIEQAQQVTKKGIGGGISKCQQVINKSFEIIQQNLQECNEGFEYPDDFNVNDIDNVGSELDVEGVTRTDEELTPEIENASFNMPSSNHNSIDTDEEELVELFEQPPVHNCIKPTAVLPDDKKSKVKSVESKNSIEVYNHPAQLNFVERFINSIIEFFNSFFLAKAPQKKERMKP